jgi:5-(carboxyamino)imidazole ribonucleotide synthase
MKNKLGIVGGGQLGRMLTFEAKKLGFYVAVLDPTPKSPAGQVADEQIVAGFKDEKAIKKLAKQSDFLTFEIELAGADILEEISEQGVMVNPSARSLNIIKDKLVQKQFLRKHHIPSADFAEVSYKGDLLEIAEDYGFPLVLKARFDAYDGRGNVLIKTKKDIDYGLQKLIGRKLYVEKFVPFKKELAVMVARNTKGQIEVYPVVETVHENNICHTVFAPARVNSYTAKKAEKLAKDVMTHLKGAGVFGIEMFLTRDNRVLINEIAPRVHNSGHYSLEACVTNQFEQHIRAVTGLPLGNTDLIVPAAVMINVLGQRTGAVEVYGMEKALAIPGVSVHIYGKKDTKIERKMGHITAIGKSIDMAWKKARSARRYISI